jgi:hypothetical protein
MTEDREMAGNGQPRLLLLSAMWGLIVGYLFVASSPQTWSYAPIQIPQPLLYSGLFLGALVIALKCPDVRLTASCVLLVCLTASLVFVLVLLAPTASPLISNKGTYLGSVLLQGMVVLGFALMIQIVGGVLGVFLATSDWLAG